MSTYLEKLKVLLTAKDEATPVFRNVATAVVGIAAAYKAWDIATDVVGAAVKAAAEHEATMKSLAAVSESTGRDYNEILAQMKSQIGGVASEAVIASGFLKGMTTELTVKQVNNMTTAIKDASIAMGEDFQAQFPLIIKAIKQLNPAILDNIGVTVRLDRVNKLIKEGYYGLNTEINEATQQNAIYHEIMKQTAKFRGQEAALLETTKGQYMALKASVDDFLVSFGSIFTESGIIAGALGMVNDAIRGLTDIFKEDIRPFHEMLDPDMTLEQAEAARQLGDRYDELTTKTELTNAEEIELAEILERFTQIMPGVITQWDEHGKAVAANVESLDDIINKKREHMAIEESEQLAAVNRMYEDYTARVEQSADVLQYYTDVIRANVGSEEERNRLVEKYNKIQKDMAAGTIESGAAFTRYLAVLGHFQDMRIGKTLEEFQDALYETKQQTDELTRSKQALIEEFSTLYPNLENNKSMLDHFMALYPELTTAVLEYQLQLRQQAEAEAAAKAAGDTLAETIAGMETRYVKLKEKMEESTTTALLWSATVHRMSNIEIPDFLPDEDDIIDQKEWLEDMIESLTKAMNQRNKIYVESTTTQKQLLDDMLAYEKMSDDQRMVNKYNRMVELGEMYAADAAYYIQMEREKMAEATFMNDIIVENAREAVHNNIDAWLDGRQSFKDIFAGIAEDWAKYFIRQILHQTVNDLIGDVSKGTGLLGLLGSLFDNPANDAMAARQGADFARHFTRGAMDEFHKANMGRNITGDLTTSPYLGGPPSLQRTPTSAGQTIILQIPEIGGTDTDAVLRQIVPQLIRMANNNEVPFLTKDNLSAVVPTYERIT